MVVIFLAFNANFFPPKERKVVEVLIYYNDGHTRTKRFDIPANSTICVNSTSHKYKEPTTNLWFHGGCIFGHEFGYLAFDVNDFNIIHSEYYNKLK